MTNDIRKSLVNTPDPEAADVLMYLDPMNYPVIEDFDLEIIDEDWISIMGVTIFVKGLIYSEAIPLHIINGFNLFMTEAKRKESVDKFKFLQCIYNSEQQDKRNSEFAITII